MTDPMTPGRMLEIGTDPESYDDAVLFDAWAQIRDRKEHRAARKAIRAVLVKRGLAVPPLTPPSKKYVALSSGNPHADFVAETKQKPAAELTERREILRRLAATQKGGIEAGSLIMFEAALEMFVLLGRLKISEENGKLLSTEEYITAAASAGVGRTYAYEVIQFRLYDQIKDIRDRSKLDHKDHVGRGDKSAFEYPSIKAMLKHYRPDKPKKPRKGNRETDAVVEENLQLTEEVKALSEKVETERAAHELEKNHFREFRSEAEETIEQLRAKVAELEAENERLRTAANVD